MNRQLKCEQINTRILNEIVANYIIIIVLCLITEKKVYKGTALVIVTYPRNGPSKKLLLLF